MEHKIEINKDIDIPAETFAKWQELVDILARFAKVPAALIMKVEPPIISVFTASKTDENPYKTGSSDHLAGLYCETVLMKKEKLLVPNALTDAHWKNNPDIKLGMVSYFGYPLQWPDKKLFGTICILDTKENPYDDDIEKLMLSFKELVEFHLELLMNIHIQGLRINELEKFPKHMVQRELRMIELKKEIAELKKKAGGADDGK
jgi:c-di-GMP phosphodiesterase